MENKQQVFDADIAVKVYKEELKEMQDELILWKLKFYQLQKVTNELLEKINQANSNEVETDRPEN